MIPGFLLRRGPAQWQVYPKASKMLGIHSPPASRELLKCITSLRPDMETLFHPRLFWEKSTDRQYATMVMRTRWYDNGINEGITYKVHGANMVPTWGRQVPGGPHFGPIILALCVGSWSSNELIIKNWQSWVLYQHSFICARYQIKINGHTFVIKHLIYWMRNIFACSIFQYAIISFQSLSS